MNEISLIFLLNIFIYNCGFSVKLNCGFMAEKMKKNFFKFICVAPPPPIPRWAGRWTGLAGMPVFDKVMMRA